MASPTFLSILLVALPMLYVSAAPAPVIQPRASIADFCHDTYAGDQKLWNELGVGDQFAIIAR